MPSLLSFSLLLLPRAAVSNFFNQRIVFRSLILSLDTLCSLSPDRVDSSMMDRIFPLGSEFRGLSESPL